MSILPMPRPGYSLLCGMAALGFFAFVLAPVRAQDFPRRPRVRPDGNYQIQGKVVDAKSGQPLADAEISIFEGPQGESAGFDVAESAADGSFRFTRLPEGKYTLRAKRQGYAGQALMQHENFWTGVAVGPGKDSLHVRFPLHPSASISGQVLDENGQAVRGATVSLWKQNLQGGKEISNTRETSQTDDEGRYRFGHLTAGKYTVSVTAKPWYSRYTLESHARYRSYEFSRERSPFNSLDAPAISLDGAETQTPPGADESLPDLLYPTLYFPGVADIRSVGWMNVAEAESANADFHLQAVPSVHFQVLTGSHSTALEANRRFALQQETLGGGSDTVDFYQSMVAPGVAEISGIAPGHYQLIGEGRGDEDDPEHAQELDLPGSGQVQLDAPLAAGPKVRGELRLERGEPLLFATLELKDNAGHNRQAYFRGAAPPDAPAPVFEFAQLPPGPGVYQLSIQQPAGVMIEKLEVTGAKVSGGRIETDGVSEISVLLTVQHFNLFLDGLAVKNGKPFAGAMILLMPEQHQDWERLVRRDQSDSDGTFHLPDIAPGKYTVLALENGWDLEWSKPEVLVNYLAKGLQLEFTEKPRQGVALEVQ